MSATLRRLVSTGAAYQASDVVAKVIALGLLPVYTRHLTRADYGTAEVLLTTVILASIVARLGLGEALVRLHYDDADPDRRRRVARAAVGTVLALTTIAAGLAAVFAGPVSSMLLGEERVDVVRAAALGLWAFTNLEMAYALLRVDQRAREYLTASLVNVALTVGLTLWLVVVRDEGAFGLLLGNFAASSVVLVGLWTRLPGVLGFDRAELRAMLRFGLPTVPAEVSVFAMFFVDRLWLYRFESESAAGLYSLATKLAAAVIFSVRAFQLAWPPLAYSIASDEEARRVYARVATAYVAFSALIVAAVALLGRWVVRALAAPAFFEAHEALPWVALGWALYGLFLVLVAMAGRAKVTVRNFPAALCGLAANVVLLALLVPALGIAGAGLALVGAYAVMLVAMWLLTRGLFRVEFEWARLALIVVVAGGVAVAGELLLPASGADGFALRVLAWLVIPAALAAAGLRVPIRALRRSGH